MTVSLQLFLVVAVLAPLPWLIRWGMRNARGSAGGVALLIGMAFGHLFDPARGQATEEVLKQRDRRQEAEAGEGPGRNV